MSPYNILHVSDVHAPYHCERSVQALEEWVKRRRKPFDEVILNGDGVDMYAASKFSKSPKRKALVAEEVEEALPVLKRLRALGRRGTYILGNHEIRYDALVRSSAPMLEGITNLHKLLELDRWDRMVPYKRQYRIGKCYFTHDLGSYGINAVRNAIRDSQHSIFIGHVHRMQIEYTGNLVEERRVGASFGWLGDESEIDYAHQHQIAQWQKGFGHIEMYSDRSFHVFPHPIINGKVLG